MTIEFIDPRDAPGGLGPIWQGNADNDTPALQWAIDQGKATGGRVMLPASAVGQLHAPIDCTSNNLPADRSLTIEGYGNSWGGSRVIFVTGTNAVGFDCVGAQRISLRRFWYSMGVQLFAGLVISASTARPCDKTLFSELRGDGPTAMGAFYAYAWGSSGVRFWGRDLWIKDMIDDASERLSLAVQVLGVVKDHLVIVANDGKLPQAEVDRLTGLAGSVDGLDVKAVVGPMHRIYAAHFWVARPTALGAFDTGESDFTQCGSHCLEVPCGSVFVPAAAVESKIDEAQRCARPHTLQMSRRHNREEVGKPLVLC